MKTLLVVMISSFLFPFSNGISDGYQEAMKKQIGLLHQARSLQTINEVHNALQRISEAEPEKWEPHYYQAYLNIRKMDLLETKETKDQALDAALVSVKKGLSLGGDLSELTALEGYVHMMRVSLDPGSRGAEYSGKAMGSLNKALGINPENPRAMALLSNMQLGTARFFGSDTKEACDAAKKAMELLEKEKNQTDSGLMPKWGYYSAKYTLDSCG